MIYIDTYYFAVAAFDVCPKEERSKGLPLSKILEVQKDFCEENLFYLMEINPFIRQEIETKWKDNFRLEGDILYLINDDFCG